MAYSLSWEHGGVVKRHVGELTSEDLLSSTQEIQGSPDFDSLHWVICDMRDCTKIVADQSTLEQVIASEFGAAHSNLRLKVAVVTTSPEVRNLAEHYRNAMEGAFPVEVFSTMDEARDWVKLMDGHMNLPTSMSSSRFR